MQYYFARTDSKFTFTGNKYLTFGNDDFCLAPSIIREIRKDNITRTGDDDERKRNLLSLLQQL